MKFNPGTDAAVEPDEMVARVGRVRDVDGVFMLELGERVAGGELLSGDVIQLDGLLLVVSHSGLEFGAVCWPLVGDDHRAPADDAAGWQP